MSYIHACWCVQSCSAALIVKVHSRCAFVYETTHNKVDQGVCVAVSARVWELSWAWLRVCACVWVSGVWRSCAVRERRGCVGPAVPASTDGGDGVGVLVRCPGSATCLPSAVLVNNYVLTHKRRRYESYPLLFRKPWVRFCVRFGETAVRNHLA